MVQWLGRHPRRAFHFPPKSVGWLNAVEVAETVWRAYHEDKLHWYIPEDLRDFHVQVVSEPEVVKEERTALLSAMTQ